MHHPPHLFSLAVSALHTDACCCLSASEVASTGYLLALSRKEGMCRTCTPLTNFAMGIRPFQPYLRPRTLQPGVPTRRKST